MTMMADLTGSGVSPHPPAMSSDTKDGNFNESTGKGNFFVQYKALVRRNITLKLRERRKTLTEFIMPLYFIAVLALIRLAIPDTTFDSILEPHGEDSLKNGLYMIANKTLHVSPNTTQVEKLITMVTTVALENGVLLDTQYYDTEDELVDSFRVNKSIIDYAVVFPEDPLGNLTYKLRLNPMRGLPSPSTRYVRGEECRAKSKWGDLSWNCPTNLYYYSGFAALQTLIDTSIIRLTTTKMDAAVPDVLLQSYPKDQYLSSGTVVLRSMVPLYMVFAWAQFIIYMMMMVVEEKEKRIKEAMKMMGLRDSVYWLSWFTIYGGYVIVLAVICTIILPLANILPNVNVFLLFLLFILYGFSSIVLALMMTPFINKAKVAGIVGSMTQVFFSLLYYLQVFIADKLNSGIFWALGLLSPCAFSLALDKALYWDFYGGLSYDQLWEGPGLPFAGSLIMISIDIVLYLSLAYYLDNVIPSEFGTKRKPWFIFQKSFWCSQDNGIKFDALGNENEGYEHDPIPESDDLEPVSSELVGKAAVRIRNLKKIFNSRGKNPVRAVDGISMDIYENQITAILGHNGAGKTTLFNLLTGMLAPTSGTASIFGLDINDANDLTNIRRITGVCPQHDIIFMTLTPREHLSFYARIRGILPKQVKSEVEKTLREVDLFTKADTKAADLSGGQKRKLSIGIALIGDPKLIFLDEPTAGVDAYSRRRLWRMLKGRKQGKVILLTTHFMDEADILADRKAIVSKGRLRCFGSSLFLKNKFGLGYHLTLVVDGEVDPGIVTKIIQERVKESQLIRHYAKEMSYILPSDSATVFPALFTLLDHHIKDKASNAGIEGYGITMTTLEEVFLTLSEENEAEGHELRSIDNLGQQMIKHKSPSASPLHQVSNPDQHDSPAPLTANGMTPGVDSQGFAIESVDVKPTKWRTFKALFKVRIVSTLREPGAVFFLIFLPLVFTSVAIFLASIQEVSVATDDILPITTGLYDGISGALVHNNTGHEVSSLDSYFSSVNINVTPYDGMYKTIFDMRPTFTAWDVDGYPYSESDPSPVNMTLGFNDTYIHSIPILLNILSNSILESAGLNQTITLVSQLLPSFENGGTFDAATFFAPMMIGFTFTMMPAALGVELVYDREIKIRDLLRLNGVGFDLYFASLLGVMILMYIVNYAGLLIIIAAFGLKSLTIPAAFGSIAILYLFYMPCALLYSAVFCYLFDKSETARQFYPNIATTVGFVGYTAVAVVDITQGFFSDDNPAQYIHYAFCVALPHYIPFGILYYINRIYLMCSIEGSCDDLTSSDYMTPEIIVMFVMVLVNIPLYYILLRLADSLKFGSSWKEALWMKGSVKKVSNKEDGIDVPTGEDDDVQEERQIVSAALNSQEEAPPVLIYDLGKVYAQGKENNPCAPSKKEDTRFVALKSVSFEVKAGQVFGLLGPNGAGKTTTLRIMTAQESPSKGQVRISGTDVISSLSEVFGNLGYCPQHDSLWRNTTVAEHIECFAAIRGVQEKQLKPLAHMYLKGLEIMEHKKKKSKDCSGGTKRKLSYILSMIGKPQVVLLDEPSTGMDPQSKRFLWNSIIASFKGNRSAILTTHSMEEADALCSRIGILVRGGMRCIGAIQHLKNKYGGGYSLELKLSTHLKGLRISASSPGNTGPTEISEVMKHKVKETFPNAYVDEEFEERIIYKIPQCDVTSLSECFSMLAEAKNENLIQEYALSQTTLEQVFLKFARQQEEAEIADEESSSSSSSVA